MESDLEIRSVSVAEDAGPYGWMGGRALHPNHTPQIVRRQKNRPIAAAGDRSERGIERSNA
jgi:hypothetical protein